MLQYFIKQVHCNNFLCVRPTCISVCSCCATQVERRAIKESAYGAGAREVFNRRTNGSGNRCQIACF